jgi:hypothetical protein
MAAAGFVFASASASAQESPSPGRLNVFISPSGEPFRAAKGQPYPVDVWFNRADANHDGVLTLDEFEADAVAFFRKLDANGDGVIDGFEINDYEQKIAPEILPRIGRLTARDIPPLPYEGADEDRRRQAQAQAQAQANQEAEEFRSRRRGSPMSGAAAFALIREPEPVAAADADFDGKVTLAEMKAAARRRFAELDVKHTGRIARADLPKTPAEQLAEKAEKSNKHPDEHRSRRR